MVFLVLFAVNYGRPAGLYRNLARADDNHWIALELVGTRSNRDGIGAKLYLTTADGLTQMREVHSGDSLGAGSDRAWRIEIIWLSGVRQTLTDVATDQRLVVTEPGG